MNKIGIIFAIVTFLVFLFWMFRKQTRPTTKKGINVLLIWPETPKGCFWSFHHALKFILKKAAFPPLGLITIAAMLPKNWNLRLVDLNVKKLTKGDLKWADVALISAMIVQKDSAQKVINRCKEAGVKVIVGGPLFSVAYQEFPQVDHFLLGEAESEILQLFLDDFEKGNAKRVYARPVIRPLPDEKKVDERELEKLIDFFGKDADVKVVKSRPKMSKSPIPRFDLLNLKRYDSMALQMSRGCPHSCEFCYVTAMLGHKPRLKSAGQIIAELNSLYLLGWRGNIFFVDDNFIGNKEILHEEILPAMIMWHEDKLTISFQTEASIDLADDECLIRQMIEAGFNVVFIGIETTSQDCLAECKKSHNKKRDFIKDVKLIQRLGLEVQAGFILGFDKDPMSIPDDIINLIQKSPIVIAMVGLLQALPGTVLHLKMENANRLREWVSGNNTDGTTNITPVNTTLEALRGKYRDVIQSIYNPEKYYQRLKNFLEEYQMPKIKKPLTISRIVAFFRSIWTLGLWSKERKHYWEILWWTIRKYPKKLPTAITYTILGHHLLLIASEQVIKGIKI